MDKPAQTPLIQQPVKTSNSSLWFAWRWWVFLALAFAVVLAFVYWLTPVEPYATLHGSDKCHPLLFSPDSSMLVTCEEGPHIKPVGPLRVWDIAGGFERFSVASDWKAIETVLFSPDCSLLAAHEEEGDLKLWNARTGEEVACLRPETHFGNSG